MSTEMTAVSGSSARPDASTCGAVSVPPWCAYPHLQRSQAFANATPVRLQRADPCNAIPPLAYRDGPHTASWLLEPDQEPVQQEGLPWELPRQDEIDQLEGDIEGGVGGLAGSADHLELPCKLIDALEGAILRLSSLDVGAMCDKHGAVPHERRDVADVIMS